MNNTRTKKWKKILGITLASVLSAGALTGIGFGAYNIANKTNISSDFSEGRSIQLNLRLYRTDENGDILVDKKTKQPIKLYLAADEEENVKKSAKALTNILKNKGLTNIQVSYGYSYAKNVQKIDNLPLFKDELEPIGVLYANFENAESTFQLKDIDDEVNTLFNDKQIFNTLNDNFSYEIELVKPSYDNRSGSYKLKNNASTGRSAYSSILANKEGKYQDGNKLTTFSYYDTDLMENNKINIFKDRDGKEINDAVSYTLKSDLDWSYFNSYQFGEQNKEYEELKKANNEGSNDKPSDESTDKPSVPDELKTYQTKYTWFLWKDKQGLIDYLNSLIGIWYFNLYANKVQGSAFDSANKDEIIKQLFPTENDPKYIRDSTSSAVRKQINTVIDSLTDVEKSFIASIVLSNGYSGGASSNTLLWNPPLIKENDLIPVLYNFLNDKIFSPAPPSTDNSDNADDPDGNSNSVKQGWSFLESTNSDLNSFIGQYYVGTIDYRNFNKYFEDPNPPKEATENGETPIPDPYVTNQFKIDCLSEYSVNAKTFANILNNENYKFPLITPNIRNVTDNWYLIIAEIQKLEDMSNTIPLEQYNEKKLAFANEYFIGNNLYSEQYTTPASIAKSIVSSSVNPLNILLIVLSAIIFLVGIFISIRYRIPGIFAFITSGLVFVLSALLYNAFGFVFSFYSLLALAIGTFLSFIVPSFLFRNIEKEVAEGSSLSAAILKSTKKYWKMSLDTHVMSILASLAFLFFGKTGNINFGAMLIVSIFLSFILSGIIYFILLLFYVYVIQFDQNTWFVSNKLFKKLGTGKEVKKILYFNKVNFFNKPSYIVIGVFVLIGLIGTIFVSVHGPIISLDFSSSSILVINNFDKFNLTQNGVIDALSINASNAYVFDNQLVIYTLNNLDINNVLNTLKSLVGANEYPLLADNLFISTLTSEYALSIVQNTLECMGIAIGFCSIWSILSLNIVSIIPLAFIQLMSMLITVGFTSLIAVPIDLNTIASFIFIFIISTALSTSLISSVKSSWDRKTLISKNDLKTLINSIIAKITPNYVYINAIIIIFAIFSLALSSTTLIYSFVIIIIGALYSIFINNSILVLTWFGFVLIRNIFDKELLKSKNEKLHHVHDYDDINEQKIVGINC